MEDEIVVVGTRYYVDNQFSWNDWGGGGGYGGGNGYGGDSGGGYYAGGGPTEPPPEDNEIIVVAVKFDRAKTATEQRAIDNLLTQINKQTAVINALDDKAQVKLKDGSIVTGAELKQIWSKTDFVINENGTTYANGTDRGEANYNKGNPQVSFNIGTLAAYDANTGGMAYVIAHELGHMIAAGRASNSAFTHGSVNNDSNEQIANDIARAIVNLQGGPILANPGSGYSTTSEQYFSVPATQTADNGSGYGGGGYGDGSSGGYYDGNHHYPWHYQSDGPYQYA